MSKISARRSTIGVIQVGLSHVYATNSERTNLKA